MTKEMREKLFLFFSPLCLFPISVADELSDSYAYVFLPFFSLFFSCFLFNWLALEGGSKSFLPRIPAAVFRLMISALEIKMNLGNVRYAVKNNVCASPHLERSESKGWEGGIIDPQ